MPAGVCQIGILDALTQFRELMLFVYLDPQVIQAALLCARRDREVYARVVE